MKMRCLGGPNDGEWCDINTAIYRVGDCYKLPQVVGLFDPDKIPELITDRYGLYRVCKLYFNKDDIYYFLAPNDWSDMQALVFQLEKKNIKDYSLEELYKEIYKR